MVVPLCLVGAGGRPVGAGGRPVGAGAHRRWVGAGWALGGRWVGAGWAAGDPGVLVWQVLEFVW